MRISGDPRKPVNQRKTGADDHSTLPERNDKADNKAARTGVLDRRRFVGASVTGLLAAAFQGIRRSFANQQSAEVSLPPDAPVEYIVVGSGPGGGPLACNLARAGHKVVLFEAGGEEGDDLASVPFFAGATTEDAEIRWDYYVRHYVNDAQQLRDSKFYPAENGVWYPRVGSLGGCSLHSFMVDIYPSDSDWENIETLTGDHSWNPRRMRRHFEQLEKCLYVPQTAANPSRHGYEGWQPTEFADSTVYNGDTKVSGILQAAASVAGDIAFSISNFFAGLLDVNDWRIRNKRVGVFPIPLFTLNGDRYGPRQFIRETRTALPNNLIVMENCLVTRVLFQGTTAVGVEYTQGKHVYRADPNITGSGGSITTQSIYAAREVILSAGTFNSPQLLKLSGVGPADELLSYGITPIVDLPGVGQNLQDRYEISVVTNLTSDYQFAAACTPGQAKDPCYAGWLQGVGPYTGYGAPGGVVLKSQTAQAAGALDPDLLISIAFTRFQGYYHGYSTLDLAGPGASHQLSWIILKAHTLNRAGTVELRSADPRDTPVITFRYFEEGSPGGSQDLSALVDAVEFARQSNAELPGIANGELVPGPLVQSREDIAQFIRNNAWGHHASCTCAIGPRSDPMAVIDSNFSVHGTRNLRVVDASVFPRIPGYFILMPIYMISQKAADVILATAKQSA